jgi:hypothetical protein
MSNTLLKFLKQLRPVVYFNSLPPPLKISTYFYLSGLLSYNVGQTFKDSKKALSMFNSKTIPHIQDKYNGEYNYQEENQRMYYEKLKKCSNDLEAAKLGASYFQWERFWHSIVFPLTMVSDIVPTIVVSLHGKKE